MRGLSKALQQHLGVVIAVRELRDSRGRRVVVRVGAPRPSARDWECPFAITGGSEKVMSRAMGVDSMQALQLAFAGLRASLVSPTSRRLSWFPGVEWLGFPRQVPEDLGPDLEEKVERLIELASLKSAVKGRRSHAPELNLDERERPMSSLRVKVDDDLLRRIRSMAKDSRRSNEQVASDLLASISGDDEQYAAVTAHYRSRGKRRPKRNNARKATRR